MQEPKNSNIPQNDESNTAVDASLIDRLIRFRKLLIVITHITVFTLSVLVAFILRSDMRIEREWFVKQYPLMLVLILPVKLVVFGFFRQYRGWWRYVGITDFIEQVGEVVLVIWEKFRAVSKVVFDKLFIVSRLFFLDNEVCFIRAA